MFTGIVSETGKVESISRKGLSFSLKVKCKNVNKDLEMGDSVAVNGVCLSVVGKFPESATFDVVKNTFNITNLKRLKKGDPVNLEGSLKMGDKLSGHMVTGHIDGERLIKANKNTPDGWMIEVAALAGDEKYLVPKGAVAVDGVSLTIGDLFPGSFRVFLIPHTLKNTTFELKKAGDYVNVEFDILAKYAERKGQSGSITKEMLMEKGFI